MENNGLFEIKYSETESYFITRSTPIFINCFHSKKYDEYFLIIMGNEFHSFSSNTHKEFRISKEVFDELNKWLSNK